MKQQRNKSLSFSKRDKLKKTLITQGKTAL